MTMRSPFDYKSILLLGIGAGIFFGSNLFGYRYPVQLVVSAIGVLLMVVGLILGIHNTIAFRQELTLPTMETVLEKGEELVRFFPGGHRISKFSGSMGKWYVTNRRLIYEGEKPGAFGSDQDILIFPLKKLVDVKIVEAGRFDKFIEADFKNEGTGKKVQILCRKREDFMNALEKAVSELK